MQTSFCLYEKMQLFFIKRMHFKIIAGVLMLVCIYMNYRFIVILLLAPELNYTSERATMFSLLLSFLIAFSLLAMAACISVIIDQSHLETLVKVKAGIIFLFSLFALLSIMILIVTLNNFLIKVEDLQSNNGLLDINDAYMMGIVSVMFFLLAIPVFKRENIDKLQEQVDLYYEKYIDMLRNFLEELDHFGLSSENLSYLPEGLLEKKEQMMAAYARYELQVSIFQKATKKSYEEALLPDFKNKSFLQGDIWMRMDEEGGKSNVL